MMHCASVRVVYIHVDDVLASVVFPVLFAYGAEQGDKTVYCKPNKFGTSRPLLFEDVSLFKTRTDRLVVSRNKETVVCIFRALYIAFTGRLNMQTSFQIRVSCIIIKRCNLLRKWYQFLLDCFVLLVTASLSLK